MQLHDILLLRTSAILPEAISAGGLTPTTDTSLFFTTYRGGSHLPADITLNFHTQMPRVTSRSICCFESNYHIRFLNNYLRLSISQPTVILILKRIITFCTGADSDCIFYVVYEDFTITDMSGIKCFLSSFNNSSRRYFTYYDINLDLRQ